MPDVKVDDWQMPWNAKSDAGRLAAGIPQSNFWASDPSGLDQVGCVYTAQGFEFDYVGVIFGSDLRWDPATESWIGDPELLARLDGQTSARRRASRPREADLPRPAHPRPEGLLRVLSGPRHATIRSKPNGLGREPLIRDERWPVARLIPITSATGQEAKERNAASALLAVLSVVNEFGRTLLKPLGAPAGKIEVFVEVPFKVDGGKTLRPDGLIGVTRAGKTWWALVECKIADQLLVVGQMEAYLDLARTVGIDAVLSISNQFTSSSSDYPIPIDRKKLKRVSIHHWSWVRVLTEAEVQRQYRGVKDPDQAYILGELIRYLSDPRSGVVQFDDMGPSWTAVREGARLHTLRKSDPHVDAIAARWDELIRFLSLDLTKELGRDVKQLMRREESTPVARHQALRDSLASKGRLYAELQIPDTAGSLEIVADLGSRQIIVSTEVAAPQDGQGRGRISWIVRQLQKAPVDLTVETRLARTSSRTMGQLSAIREDPGLLLPDGGREIRAFRLSLTRDLGLNRAAGRGSFIDGVVGASKTYYRDVLQNLTAWKPRAPRLPVQDVEAEPLPPGTPEPIEVALQTASEEMEGETQ